MNTRDGVMCRETREIGAAGQQVEGWRVGAGEVGTRVRCEPRARCLA